LAGWPDCGERFAVIRLTICGEAKTTKAKPALEGRALFGDEAPETQFIAVLNFPKMTLEGERRGIMDVHLPNRRMASTNAAMVVVFALVCPVRSAHAIPYLSDMER
jgi:hypothetical protein